MSRWWRWLLLLALLSTCGCAGFNHTHRLTLAGCDADAELPIEDIWSTEPPPALLTGPPGGRAFGGHVPGKSFPDIECDSDGCWFPDWYAQPFKCDRNRCWMDVH